MNELPSARNKILALVAATSLALVAAAWALGRDSSGGDFAVAGVRAAVAHVDPDALAPSAEADADAPPPDDATDAGEAEEADDDGDAFSDWLAEAEARAKLAAAAHSAGGPGEPAAVGSAIAGAARDAGAAQAAQQPFGRATRLRNIGLQLIAICTSGHAAEVQPLAVELLAERPAPWLAKRVRAACLHENEPPPAPPPPEEPED